MKKERQSCVEENKIWNFEELMESVECVLTREQFRHFIDKNRLNWIDRFCGDIVVRR